jgi:hypothetical protein
MSLWFIVVIVSVATLQAIICIAYAWIAWTIYKQRTGK